MLSIPLFKYLFILGLSTGIVILLTPSFIKLAPYFGLIDQPNERRIHKQPIPVGAGIVVFISFHISCFLLYQVVWPSFSGKLDMTWWSAFFIASGILLIFGLIDDRYGMSALTKLAGQTIAISCLYFLSDYQVNLLNIDLGLFTGWLFVLFWTLTIINAFNLIDGLDGLCSGLALISSIGLAGVFIFRDFPGDALICLVLVGGCLGFLRYNFHPAKVFLGDTGSMFLGFALASISLQAGGKGSLFVLLATPFFVAGIPIIDTLLAIWRRSIRKILAKKNGDMSVKVMQADREHLHHRLLDSGLKQHHVALTLYIANAAIVMMGLSYFLFREISTGLFLIIFIITLYLLIKYVLHIELWETSRLLIPDEEKPYLSRFNIMFYPLFDLSWMSAMVWLSDFIVFKGDSSFHSMGDWFADLPLWMTPVFSLLFISKSYIKVWRNTFFRDYLTLSLAIIVGCLFSLGLLLIFHLSNKFLLLNQMLIFCFLISLGIIGIRIPHHFLREWGLTVENSPLPEQRNILIYGASANGGLYLRKRQLKYCSELGKVRIIGFLDDDDKLKNQYTFGLKVLGNVHDLKALAEKFFVNEIVLTTALSKENFALLQKTAQEMNIKLLNWNPCATLVEITNAV